MTRFVGKYKIHDSDGNLVRWGAVSEDGTAHLRAWGEGSANQYDNEMADVPEIEPDVEDMPPEAG